VILIRQAHVSGVLLYVRVNVTEVVALGCRPAASLICRASGVLPIPGLLGPDAGRPLFCAEAESVNSAHERGFTLMVTVDGWRVRVGLNEDDRIEGKQI
jgi:hypothetical protein